MNLYQCWYQGIPGLCCKQAQDGWIFVPDSGLAHSRIHKHLDLSDLVFRNRSEYHHELQESRTRRTTGIRKFLPRNLSNQAVTVGGRLFMSGQ